MRGGVSEGGWEKEGLRKTREMPEPGVFSCESVLMKTEEKNVQQNLLVVTEIKFSARKTKKWKAG